MHPSNSTIISPAYITRTAAIVAYGLLYIGSNSKNQIEKIVIDFEKAKYSDSDSDNAGLESYLVGCGFAVVRLYIIVGICCTGREWM